MLKTIQDNLISKQKTKQSNTMYQAMSLTNENRNDLIQIKKIKCYLSSSKYDSRDPDIYNKKTHFTISRQIHTSTSF